MDEKELNEALSNEMPFIIELINRALQVHPVLRASQLRFDGLTLKIADVSSSVRSMRETTNDFKTMQARDCPEGQITCIKRSDPSRIEVRCRRDGCPPGFDELGS